MPFNNVFIPFKCPFYPFQMTILSLSNDHFIPFKWPFYPFQMTILSLSNDHFIPFKWPFYPFQMTILSLSNDHFFPFKWPFERDIPFKWPFYPFQMTILSLSNDHFPVHVSTFNFILIIIINNVNCNSVIRNLNILMFLNRKLNVRQTWQTVLLHIRSVEVSITHKRMTPE